MMDMSQFSGLCIMIEIHIIDQYVAMPAGAISTLGAGAATHTGSLLFLKVICI